jgi:drug/metabolite transporter (DMT)-like permease
MEKWVILSLGLIAGSVVLYLFIRKSKDVGMPTDIQNLAMFLPQAVFMAIYTLAQGNSFKVSLVDILTIVVAAIFLSWLGNIASLRALVKAPNPGYSLVISKSYVLMTSILSVWIFGSALTGKSIIAIVLIVIFSAVIILERKEMNIKRDKGWIWLTLAAFLAWGFLALVFKYLTNKGLLPAVMLFYMALFVSILILAQLVLKRAQIKFEKNYWSLFLVIGLASALFNLFMVVGYKYAPNPGYINAANAGSIALVTVFSALIFKDELNIRKVIGVVGVVGSLILLFI